MFQVLISWDNYELSCLPSSALNWSLVAKKEIKWMAKLKFRDNDTFLSYDFYSMDDSPGRWMFGWGYIKTY